MYRKTTNKQQQQQRNKGNQQTKTAATTIKHNESTQKQTQNTESTATKHIRT